ncbi:MAG TPA: ATP-binding protein, partial [Tepidisphaeraceae bacterium]|nr:ATP-binding protein [Tepidisphaeraceae bacterium]
TADDQVETVFQRLVRGSGIAGLVGMSAKATVSGVVIRRPLLGIRREMLRQYLQSIGQSWREDSSNASDQYSRNRIRNILARDEDVDEALLYLSRACRELRHWTRAHAPKLAAEFNVIEIQNLPDFLARESARLWLANRGVPGDDLRPDVVARLIEMANDAATPSRLHFPGTILVRRRRGMISADRT